jgi:1,4-dihydroxy-2-naphthoyl-CoA hydrolase
VSAGELTDRMGIEVIEATVERVVLRMPVVGNRQAFGFLHGGAYCVLGETAGSIAANLHGGEGMMALGVDISATHLRSVSEGWLTATATPLRLGRSICTHQVDIVDDGGTLVSSVRITNALRRLGAVRGTDESGDDR